MKQIILIGGGGRCRSCIDVIEAAGREIGGILDATLEVGNKVMGYPVIGSDDDIPRLTAKYSFLVTLGCVGRKEKRARIYERILSSGGETATVLSPRSYISKTAKMGSGTIVMHDALINSNATVGQNWIINTKALIEHDAVVGSHCHISTCAAVNGGTMVGDRVFGGSGAVIFDGVSVGDDSIVSGGKTVRFDLPVSSRFVTRAET